jgi:uncharacterized protein (UPF0305 family)
MVKQVLTNAGFIEGKTFKETRFLKPPKSTYAVYMDAYTRRGADAINLITEHDYTIELYSSAPDEDAEKRIENSLDYYAIPYEKESRYWIQEEQLYQVIYTFNFIEK